MKTPERTSEEEALARGVVYRYLATAFRHPDAATVKALADLEEGAKVAAEAAGNVAAPHLAALAAAAARSAEDLLAVHARVFGHVAQGDTPPYEAEYGDGEEGLQEPHRIADVAAFYRAHGVSLARRSWERADHVSVELEFLSFLCHKEADAIAKGDDPRRGSATHGQGRFLELHAGRWLPAFSRRLAKRAPEGFYAALARATLDWLLSELARFELPSGPEHLRLRTIPDDPDTCLTCPFSTGNLEARQGQAGR